MSAFYSHKGYFYLLPIYNTKILSILYTFSHSKLIKLLIYVGNNLFINFFLICNKIKYQI